MGEGVNLGFDSPAADRARTYTQAAHELGIEEQLIREAVKRRELTPLAEYPGGATFSQRALAEWFVPRLYVLRTGVYPDKPRERDKGLRNAGG